MAQTAKTPPRLAPTICALLILWLNKDQRQHTEVSGAHNTKSQTYLADIEVSEGNNVPLVVVPVKVAESVEEPFGVGSDTTLV